MRVGTGPVNPVIIAAADAGKYSPTQLGGKGANLARLAATGARIPAWFAITTDAFAAELAGVADKPAARVLAMAAQPCSAQLRQSVLAACRALPAGAMLAVRSSAADEDAASVSFAGMHESRLFVPAGEPVLDAVRAVWQSAYSDRALAYRQAQGLPLTGIRMAVIVQVMVDAASSGVVFTVNPASGNVSELMVCALWGLGEGLVSAGLDADTFIINKASLHINTTIADKAEQVTFAPGTGAGTTRGPVADQRQRIPCLTGQQLRELAKQALAIEQFFRRPQDIEFSFNLDGELFVLQTRPITTAGEYGPAAGNHLLWDNSNITESYSGITSPLTFSFIRRAYTIVYHCFSAVMGIDAATVRANRPVFENMLGMFRGQVYYNLLNWYRLIAMFPGFSYNRGFMESMMGVREAATLSDPAPAPTAWQRYAVELPRLLRLLLRSGWNFLRLRTLAAQFDANFDRHYQRWSGLDFRALPPHELARLYREMEDALLWHWRAPIINDFYVMIFYGILKKLCRTWCGDANGSLQNDLLCGEGGIESTVPARMLLDLARQVQGDPALRALLFTTPPEAMLAALDAQPEHAAFRAALDDYLARYGFRCMNELKLEEPPLKDRPNFLFTVLRNYCALDRPEALDAARIAAHEQQIRHAAETRVALSLSLPRRLLFARVLSAARSGVKNRENMRFARTRIFGLVRELFRALGDHFAAEEILAASDDIFYLTTDEIWDYIKGTAVTTDLRGLVTLRRNEFDAYRRETDRFPAERFSTYGMAYHRNRFRPATGPATIAPADGIMRGIGCSPGIVTTPVKVIMHPSDDMRLNGEILVAARTDPGWIPLYPAAAGLLVERGSILSHSAIVAREMGIPTIVGIPHLTKRLRSGQTVRMDGAAGTVELCDGR